MNENDLKKCTEFCCAISWDIFNLSQQQNRRFYVKTILIYLKSPKWMTWKISGKVDIDIPFRLIEKCLRGLNSCHISLTESSNTTPSLKGKMASILHRGRNTFKRIFFLWSLWEKVIWSMRISCWWFFFVKSCHTEILRITKHFHYFLQLWGPTKFKKN